MTDEVKTDDNSVEAPQGQADGGDVTVESKEQATSAPATPAKGQVEEGKYGGFNTVEELLEDHKNLKNLEKFKGNWKETVSDAQKYRELMTNEPQGELVKDDGSGIKDDKAEDVVVDESNWLEMIGKKVEQVVEERVGKRLEPIEQDFNQRRQEMSMEKARNEIKEFRSAHKELTDEQWESLSVNPEFRNMVTMRGPKGERMSLENAYRLMTYEDMKKKTQSETINELKNKSRVPKASGASDAQPVDGNMDLNSALEDAIEKSGFGN